MVDKKQKIVTAGIILIGNELLSGRTRDGHVQTLAHFFTPLGVQVQEARIIKDKFETIRDTVRVFSGRFDYVVTTGGIGPTHDDITADSVAAAFGVTIEEHTTALDILRQRYGEADMNEARRRMARIPEGARLIANPVSSAPGFHIHNVFVLAGVPDIMRGMLSDIENYIKGGVHLHMRQIRGVHVREGDIAAPLANLAVTYPEVELGCYPFVESGGYGVELVIRANEEAQLDIVERALKTLVESLRTG